MNIKRISSSVLAAVMLLGSNMAFASESTIDKIKDIDASSNENKEARLTKDEVAKLYGVKARTSSEVHPDFVIGESRDIFIPAHGSYSAYVNVDSKGLLSVTASIPNDLKGTDKLFVTCIYDEEGNIVDKSLLNESAWKGQSNIIYKTGLNPGRYLVEVYTTLYADVYSNLTIGFKAAKNVELESNDDTDSANSIKLGTTYSGSLSNYDYDYYKINVPKKTRVKVTVKRNKVINKEREQSVRVQLANKQVEYLETNYEGISTKCFEFKAGDNYIGVGGNAALLDYSINVSTLSGPFMPDIYEIGDNQDYVSGQTEKGTKVYVKIGNGSSKQANVDNGRFSIYTGKIKAGTVVSIYAKNSSGVNSPVRKIKVVDRTAPNKPVINKFTVKSQYVSGTTEAKAKVLCRIAGDNKRVFETKADANGKYSIKVGKLARGTKIEVQAVDGNSNYSYISQTKVQNYVAAPKVANLSNINVNVTGTAPKGSTVYVKAGSKYYSAKTNSNGKFSVKIPKQKYKAVIKVYAKDKQGDTSVVVSKKVGYAPKKPVLKAVTTSSVKVKGSSSKNANITIKIGSKYYTGKTNSNGNFSIKIPKQKKGTVIKVQAKFASTGLKSYATSTKVK